MHHKFANSILLLLLLVISFSVEAKLYKWVDENGKTHFSQTPPLDRSQAFDSKKLDSTPEQDPECCTEVRKIVFEMSKQLNRGVTLSDLHGLVRSKYEIELTELANFASERKLMGYSPYQTASQAYSVCMNVRFGACRKSVSVAKSGDSSGSGFWVTPKIVLTNAHVVQDCDTISIAGKGKGNIRHADKSRDLALVNVSGAEGSPVYFRSASGVIQGETVVAAGFPLSGLLAEDLNVTQGIISALAGLKGDRHYFQITAPVQPGNSGGPLYDKSGAVIGIVTAKLNALSLAEQTGDIAQNINFAIQLGEIKRYLENSEISYKVLSQDASTMSTEEISRIARKETVTVRCER
jgi:S1-C subfamily serine protease